MKRHRRTILATLALFTFWGAALWLFPSRWRVPTTQRVGGGRDG